MPKRVQKALIAGFVALHLSAIAWWLIPADGLPKDARMAEPPAALKRIEESVFAFKKRHAGSLLARGLERYLFLTVSWQNWGLFAPNPPDAHDWVTVYAVLDWTSEPGAPRVPVYDPVPVYRSYEGRFAQRLRGHADAYRHDPKLIENLASGRSNRALASFAEYWSRVYREERGEKPLAIHVVLREGLIPRPFGGILPDSVPITERLLCTYNTR